MVIYGHVVVKLFVHFCYSEVSFLANFTQYNTLRVLLFFGLIIAGIVGPNFRPANTDRPQICAVKIMVRRTTPAHSR
jgi:hypothetical protein